MTLKRIISFNVIFLSLFCGYSQSNWQQLPNFPGTPSFTSVAFAINGKGYVVSGFSDVWGRLNETWEYDTTSTSWTRKANFPGTSPWYGCAFAINGKGYVVTGYAEPDLWEYDPIGDTWTQKADFPGLSRCRAVAFSIGDKGYVGLGYGFGASSGQAFKDFWEYDQLTDVWKQVADFPPGERVSATAFSLSGKGYVGLGTNNTPFNIYYKDFWEYNSTTNAWAQKADFPGGESAYTVSYTLKNYGYAGMGRTSDGLFANDNWKYDPSSNAWTSVEPIPLSSYEHTSTFTIGCNAYIVNGWPHDDNFWLYNEPCNTTLEEVNAFACEGTSYQLPNGNIVTTDGLYNDTLKSICGCDSIVATNLVFEDFPKASIYPDSSIMICKGDSVTLTGNGGRSYWWSTNETDSSITVKDEGLYDVIAYNSCGSDTASVNILYHSFALALFSPDSVKGTIPLIVQFNNESSEGTYIWDFGDGQTSLEENPSHTYFTAGEYRVSLIVTTPDGCSDTTYYKYILVQEPYVIIPNVITPNRDGDNDIFYLKGEGLLSYNGKIYNRWGETIFQFDEGNLWNGTDEKGNSVTEGVYYYSITVFLSNNTFKTYSGTISLFR